MENLGTNLSTWIGGGPGLFRILVFFLGSLVTWFIIKWLYSIFAKAKSSSKSRLIAAGAVVGVLLVLFLVWIQAGDFVTHMTQPVPVAPLLLPAKGESVVVKADPKGSTFADLVPVNQAVHIRVSKGKAKVYIDDYALFNGHPVPPKSDMTIPPQPKPWRLRIKSADAGVTTVVIEPC